MMFDVCGGFHWATHRVDRAVAKYKRLNIKGQGVLIDLVRPRQGTWI